MARKAKEKIVCQHFTWSLFNRAGLWYADGRQNRPNLGKHSLGTRDHSQAVEQLRQLDQHKAIELGKLKSLPAASAREITIPEGWELYMEHCARPDVMGGVGKTTLKRYRARQAPPVLRQARRADLEPGP